MSKSLVVKQIFNYNWKNVSGINSRASVVAAVCLGTQRASIYTSEVYKTLRRPKNPNFNMWTYHSHTPIFLGGYILTLTHANIYTRQHSLSFILVIVHTTRHSLMLILASTHSPALMFVLTSTQTHRFSLIFMLTSTHSHSYPRRIPYFIRHTLSHASEISVEQASHCAHE